MSISVATLRYTTRSLAIKCYKTRDRQSKSDCLISMLLCVHKQTCLFESYIYIYI